MSRRLRRSLITVLLVLLLLALIVGMLGLYVVRRSFPNVDGTLAVPGLQAPVTVYRNMSGVPQIYASNEHDLFMAQGFIHAQDRFWQMDFWRHVGSGTLSEMFGESQVDTDKFLRTLGWARVAKQELAQASPAEVAVLQAYADGVNAYLAQRQGTALSLEYGILKLLNPGYQPAPWTPLNSLTWAKAMAWDLGGNMDDEIERSILLKTLTPEQVAQLYPPYPADHPTILQGYGQASTPQAASQLAAIRAAAPAFSNLDASVQNLNQLLGAGLAGIGSNNWVVSGDHTTTGAPLLANDPHLGIQMPSIWYEIGLHCQPVGPDCRYDVGGFSFAGDPGVIIGHNDNIAWGLTNVGPDVQDLYIEKINPDNPNQYEVNGKWVDMTVVDETIKVAGGDPVDLKVRYTRHGPIVSDTYKKLEDFTKKAGIDLPAHYALALQWTALQPTQVFQSVLEYDRAQTWDDFRNALKDFAVPSQNFIFADTKGDIGYQMPGLVPIRAKGDGWLPVPGWTDEYAWTGYIPFDKLPSVLNPDQGFIVTANNPVVGQDYPYFISRDWDYGFRAARITQLIEAKPKLSLQDMQAIQGDDYDAAAAMTLPYLTKLSLSGPQSYAVSLMKSWDMQDKMDSAPAAIFNLFWRDLILKTFLNNLPDGTLPDGDRAFVVFQNLLQQPNSPWWDDPTTPKVETRDDILKAALAQAITDGSASMGSDLAKWQWGDIHQAVFQNQSLGESGVGPIESLLNRGPYAVSGSTSIVNATSWKVAEGFEVTTLPSMRIVNDLSNWDNTQWINTTGQSGHAYNPNYVEMADLWRNIQYLTMTWSKDKVQSAATHTLTLQP